jgi:hypothetical protein
MRSEPAVSVPVAAGTCRDASAAPEPPLEPPAGPLERPRIADLVGGPATGELVRVQMAEQDHPAADRLAHASQSRLGTSVEEPARAR